MKRSTFGISSLISGLLVCAQLSGVAEAREAAPVLTTEQVQASFVRGGYTADSPIYWQSSELTTFFVRDVESTPGATERMLLVLVYSDTAKAEEEHRLAHAQQEAELGTLVAFSDEDGPELIPGYGRSAWWLNIALVQATRLSSIAQSDSDNEQGVIVRTGASRRAELNTLNSVDTDFVDVLRSAA
jgi:hypothetical protein